MEKIQVRRKTFKNDKESREEKIYKKKKTLSPKFEESIQGTLIN